MSNNIIMYDYIIDNTIQQLLSIEYARPSEGMYMYTIYIYIYIYIMLRTNSCLTRLSSGLDS